MDLDELIFEHTEESTTQILKIKILEIEKQNKLILNSLESLKISIISLPDLLYQLKTAYKDQIDIEKILHDISIKKNISLDKKYKQFFDENLEKLNLIWKNINSILIDVYKLT